MKLFSEGKIGSLVVPNRVVMTAMGVAQSAEDGDVTDLEVAFYRERARGGVGLIITECMIIDWNNGRGNLHQTSAADDRHIPGLKRLADAVHEYESRIIGQLYHPGRQGFVHVNGVESMPAPSDLCDAMTQQPVHAMDIDEINALVDSFAQAAWRLSQAGFDGVEIHAAHGYLLNSFLSPYANLRTDQYGGSTENRVRIIKQIVEAIRNLCGKDFAVITRISADEYLSMVGKVDQGITLDEGIAIAKALEDMGCDAIDVSSGVYETMNTAWEPFAYEEGWKSHLAAEVKQAVSIPVIGVSVYRNPSFAEALLEEGKLDFVGSARAHFADPHWSSKAEAGEPGSIRRCISCLACMESLVAADETGGPSSCAINPRTGREKFSIPVDGAGKLVVVIGAGPAGLEAAVTAAERGCSVIIFEKKSQIGGQLNYAAQPPGKDKINWMIEFYQNRIEALDIDLRLNEWPRSADIAALEPAAVIIATGSEPVLPRSIPGLDGENVHTPPEVLMGEVDLSGKKVAVVGSGMTGIETAEFLAVRGCELSLFEMLPNIGPGVYFQNMMDIMPKLGAHGVQFYPEHKLLGVEGDTAAFERADGSRYEDRFDAIVISLGTRPECNCGDDIRDYIPEAVTIGDSNKPGRITDATTSAWLAIRELSFN